MSHALVMTVGTGIGNAMESLAKALAESLLNKNPDKTYFVCTKESLETVEAIKKRLPGNRDTENLVLEDCDDLDEALKRMKVCFKEVRKSHDLVTLNYTSGTKTMTAAAVFAAIIEGFDWLEVTAGSRKGGIVQSGTEKVLSYKTGKLVAEIDLRKKIVSMFNSHQYSQVEERLEELAGEFAFGGIGTLAALAQGYDLWDKFKQKEALEQLKKAAEELKSIGMENSKLYMEVCTNRGFLERLTRCADWRKYEYLLADLLNNASRRAEESKYDDAVARLYRAIEMLAEYRLKGRGLDLEKIEAVALPEPIREKWASKINNGRMEIALKEKYALLKDLGEPLGDKYEDEELKDLLKKRNHSILAHGIDPVDRDVYERLTKKVQSTILGEMPDFERLREDARFPKLEDVDWVLGLPATA